MQRAVLYAVAVGLIGASACLAWFGFIHDRLPDQAAAIPMLAAGVALAIAIWRIDHSPEAA